MIKTNCVEIKVQDQICFVDHYVSNEMWCQALNNTVLWAIPNVAIYNVAIYNVRDKAWIKVFR
jgi:hypothetical protein